MLIPLSWLKDYVDITLPVDELAYRLTMAGLEVAHIERLGADWERDKIFVAEIVRIDRHPNADRLVLATVNYGGPAPQTVVTGAPNLKVGDSGQRVPFAVVGARVIDGHKDDGSYLVIKPAKLRGVESAGMVLSEKELGLSDDHTGIIILPPDAPVGAPLADYLGDTVLDIELTPNLTRASNILGTAREVAAITGQPLRYPNADMTAEGPPVGGLAHIVIDDPDLCNRYTATVIEGVTIGPSPQWLQRRLTLAGMRPISNIVDVTNYVMLELGQPLHAFDYDRLVARAGGQPPTIIVRRAHPGEEMTTLDGQRRKLTPDMLLICDTAGPVAIAGIMGGEETEVGPNTTRILLESANFNNISTRRTSATLKLISEASSRFGRGIHPALPIQAAGRATELMRELAGGGVAPLPRAFSTPTRSRRPPSSSIWRPPTCGASWAWTSPPSVWSRFCAPWSSTCRSSVRPPMSGGCARLPRPTASMCPRPTICSRRSPASRATTRFLRRCCRTSCPRSATAPPRLSRTASATCWSRRASRRPSPT